MSQRSLPDLTPYRAAKTVHRHPLNDGIWFSERVKRLADRADAHWLLDKIAVAQIYEPDLAAERFQLWVLVVVDTAAGLVCQDVDAQQLHDERISFTDFPEPSIDLWLVDGVILPSEY